jgi:WXG100 family type VII secretion target
LCNDKTNVFNKWLGTLKRIKQNQMNSKVFVRTYVKVVTHHVVNSSIIKVGWIKIDKMKGDLKMAQIRITPEELETAADFLGTKLDAMNNEAKELKGKIDDVTDNWEGAAQSAFLAGFNEDMWPILNEKLPELINGIQAQLRATAKALEDTDTAIADKLKGK